MFIETEDTPNPATLKFLPGRYVMDTSTADFASPASAERSPLASALFELPGVARVFLGGDFITVTKAGDIAWQALKPQVLAAIMEHFVAGRPVIEGAAEADPDEDVAPEDEEIVAPDQGTAGHARAPGGGRRRRRHRVPRLSRRHREAAHAGFVLGLPVVPRDPEARHREHAPPLRAGGRRRGAGRPLSASPAA